MGKNNLAEAFQLFPQKSLHFYVNYIYIMRFVLQILLRSVLWLVLFADTTENTKRGALLYSRLRAMLFFSVIGYKNDVDAYQ